MEESPLYQELAMRLGAPPSERIPRLWQMLCDSEEARLCLAMPGTVDELAAKMEKPASEVDKMVQGLFRKGVVFEKTKGGTTQYIMSKNLLQFHDATILWPEAPQGFLDLWHEYMGTEYPELAKLVAGMDLDPVTRVLPIQQALEGGGSRVLPFESAVSILEDAKKIAVTLCTCRLTEKKCRSPLEACIQLNRAAEYALKRGTGREISVEEGKKILRECEELVIKGIGEEELNDAKTFMKGNLALSLESTEVRMSQLAKNEMIYRRSFSFDETVEKINAITLGDFSRICRHIFLDRDLTLVSIGKLPAVDEKISSIRLPL